MGRRPLARRRRLDRPAHHAVPRGGRRAGRRDHGHRPRPRHRARHARTASSAIVGGQTLEVRPADPARLDDVRRDPRRGRPATPDESPGRGVLSVPVAGDAALGAAVAPPRRRRHRASSSSRCACRASTRSSSPSPAARPPTDDTTADGGGRMTHRDARHPHAAPRPRPRTAPRRRALVRHSLALAKRSLIKTLRTPEALIDVTLQPAIFLCSSSTSSAARSPAARQHDYLQFLLPGILGPDDRHRRHRDRREPQHRHRARASSTASGRCRSPARRRCRRRARRRRPLRDRLSS